MNTTERTKTPFILTISLYFLFFAYALSATMTGPLIPVFIEQYKIGLSDSGLISVLMGIGGIVSVIIGAIISDLLKKSILVRLATFGYSISVLVIFFVQSYWLLLLIYFFIGASTKLLDAIVNAYVSDMYITKRGFYMNLLHAFYALGAVMGPIFASTLLNAGLPWKYIYLVLGVFCLCVSLFYTVCQHKAKNELKPVRTGQKRNLGELFRSRALIVLCGIVVLYAIHFLLFA